MKRTIFRRSSFVLGISQLAGGNLIAQAVPVITAPIITRLYSPVDLGVLALYTSFIGVASTMVTLGLPQAIVSAKDDQEAARLALLSVLTLIPNALLLTGALFAMMETNILGFNSLPAFAIPAMFFSLVFTGLYYALRYWLIRDGNYIGISKTAIQQSLGRNMSQVMIGIVHNSGTMLIFGEVIGRIAGVKKLYSEAGERIRRLSGATNVKELRIALYRHRKFPLLATPAALIDSMSGALIAPLIASSYGLTLAGQYSLASRILLIPMVLVGAGVADVFHKRMSEYVRTSPRDARRFFLKTTLALLLVGAPPITLLGLFGDKVLPLIFGDAWTSAGLISVALAPRILSHFVVSPLSRVMMIYQGQELKLIYNVLNLTSVVTFFWFGSGHGWSLIETLVYLSSWQVLLHCLYWGLQYRVVTRHLG